MRARRRTIQQQLERAAFRATVITWAVWWPLALWNRFG